jgi:hypothetical protein
MSCAMRWARVVRRARKPRSGAWSKMARKS